MPFSEEVRENIAKQAHLADLYVQAPQNEYIRHDVIKEAPIKLSVAIALAKDSERILGKVKVKGAQVKGRKVNRQGDGS